MQVEPVVRMFDILRSEGRNYVVQGDLKSMLAGILLSHPGLEFLQDTPEFQDRYAETVILRIIYSLDRSGLGRITLRDLKRYPFHPRQQHSHSLASALLQLAVQRGICSDELLCCPMRSSPQDYHQRACA